MRQRLHTHGFNCVLPEYAHHASRRGRVIADNAVYVRHGSLVEPGDVKRKYSADNYEYTLLRRRTLRIEFEEAQAARRGSFEW